MQWQGAITLTKCETHSEELWRWVAAAEGSLLLQEGELQPRGDESPFQGKVWKPEGSLAVFKEALISSNWQADGVENLFVWKVGPQRRLEGLGCPD